MKIKSAVLFKTNDPLKFTELETPELKDGQVLVKVLVTGICRSQVNEIKAHKGPDMYLPHTLGHEASGIVVETGSAVTKVKPGDYVVLTWIKGEGCEIPGCEYKTLEGEKINSGAITTFNDHTVVSENRVVKITKELPPKIAALLGCAIPTGCGIVKNDLKVQKNESIGIFGVGGIGMAVLLGAKMAGADPIIAIDVNEDKLTLAKELGATHTINSKTDDAVEKIKEITENKLLDYTVDCSGIIPAIETAFDALNNSGTLIIAGNPAAGEQIKVTPFEFIKGKKIIGSWGGGTKPDEDLPYYADQYLKGNLNLDILIKEYEFEDINEAIEDLKAGKIVRGILKINELEDS